MLKDYVIYGDTDSCYINIENFILNNIKDKSKWTNMNDDKKIDIVQRISKEIENNINKRIFTETQKGDYNSQVKDFKIGFKQEMIARSALFIKKKKYAYWVISDEGNPVDEISVTGLEIVRSDTAQAVRPMLKHIMEMILKQHPDDKISDQIQKYKKQLKKLLPEDLSANIGINNIDKYLKTGSPIKGTPWHIKGVHNYRVLLNELELQDKYEDIHEGIKARVVYVMKNPFNIDSITFTTWPIEFNKVVRFDTDKMIEKFFLKKINTLLEPMSKEYLLKENTKKKIDLFF